MLISTVNICVLNLCDWSLCMRWGIWQTRAAAVVEELVLVVNTWCDGDDGRCRLSSVAWLWTYSSSVRSEAR